MHARTHARTHARAQALLYASCVCPIALAQTQSPFQRKQCITLTHARTHAHAHAKRESQREGGGTHLYGGGRKDRPGPGGQVITEANHMGIL